LGHTDRYYFGGFAPVILHTRTIPEGYSQLTGAITDCDERENWPRFADGVRITCDIDRQGQQIFVRLSFSGEVILECARCLEPFRSSINGNTAITLLHRSKGSTEALDSEDGGTDFYFSDDNEDVDISPALFDEIMTEIPLKPLCSEGCKGVQASPQDAQAGRSEAVDSRWDALRKLKENRRSPE
jgi:uncharacterized protein